MFRFFTRFPFPIRAGGAPYASAALRQFTKNRKVRSFTSSQVHTLLPMPHSFPHAPRIPIRAISPYHHNLTMCPPRPARPVPQTRHPPVSSNSLRLRRRTARRRRRGTAPGHGIASRRCDGVDIAVGACVQAGPKAGACGADPRGAGQAGPGKSPQARRQGSRIAQDG